MLFREAKHGNVTIIAKWHLQGRQQQWLLVCTSWPVFCAFVFARCSVQYLQQPERVFGEVYRVLKPGGVAIFTFSNRMFYDKVHTLGVWGFRGSPRAAVLLP